MVILFCHLLASCGSFSGYVADNWPTWAGGMPKDVPPRPGEPGYQEFIAHGQARGGQAPQANNAPVATPVAAAGNAPAPAANVNGQEIPAAGSRTNGAADMQGGLY